MHTVHGKPKWKWHLTRSPSRSPGLKSPSENKPHFWSQCESPRIVFIMCTASVPWNFVLLFFWNSRMIMLQFRAFLILFMPWTSNYTLWFEIILILLVWSANLHIGDIQSSSTCCLQMMKALGGGLWLHTAVVFKLWSSEFRISGKLIRIPWYDQKLWIILFCTTQLIRGGEFVSILKGRAKRPG